MRENPACCRETLLFLNVLTSTTKKKTCFAIFFGHLRHLKFYLEATKRENLHAAHQCVFGRNHRHDYQCIWYCSLMYRVSDFKIYYYSGLIIVNRMLTDYHNDTIITIITPFICCTVSE